MSSKNKTCDECNQPTELFYAIPVVKHLQTKFQRGRTIELKEVCERCYRINKKQ